MDFALDDTIAAIATPAGEGGLAVVRVSGAGALALADAVFAGAAPLAAAASHTVHHGWVLAAPAGPGAATGAPAPAAAARERVDEVLATVLRAPRTYTREDTVELSCHGGDVPARAVLQALLAAGARLARPGEFTLRAFLNGRLDLVQAEAVAELIHARDAGGHARALRRLSGELSARLAALADALADAAAEVEARVDFAEDVGGVEVPPALPGRLAAIRDALAALARGAAWARRMREGVRVAIAGFPNAGKSSLFNRLVGEERAIVAARPGTTRDRVSETIAIAGARFTLSDTAGVRAGAGGAEREGVARALAELAASDLVLWVVDGSRPPAAGADAFAARLAGRDAVVALNKRDLGASPAAAAFTAARGLAAFEVSARTGEGVDALAAGLASAAGYAGELPRVNERQGEALAGAIAAVERARAAGVAGEPGEIVALELREALAHLAEVTGRGVGDDLLERIFSRFCVGK